MSIVLGWIVVSVPASLAIGRMLAMPDEMNHERHEPMRGRRLDMRRAG